MILRLRGVGKSVLLNRIAEQGEAIGYEQAQLEAQEGRPLANYLITDLKTILVRHDRIEQARAWGEEAMTALRGGLSLQADLRDVMMGPSEPSRVDSGNLELHYLELLSSTARAARATQSPKPS